MAGNMSMYSLHEKTVSADGELHSAVHSWKDP